MSQRNVTSMYDFYCMSLLNVILMYDVFLHVTTKCQLRRRKSKRKSPQLVQYFVLTYTHKRCETFNHIICHISRTLYICMQ